MLNFAALIKDHQKKELERLMLTSKMSKTNFFVFRIYFVDKHRAQLPIHFFSASYWRKFQWNGHFKIHQFNNLRMQLLNLACGNELNMHYQIKMRNSLYLDAEIIVKKWWWWWRQQYKWIRKQGTHRNNKLKNYKMVHCTCCFVQIVKYFK